MKLLMHTLLVALLTWTGAAYTADIHEPVMIPIPGRNYEIGKFDVTQGEWKAVMGSNPSHFSRCGDNCPVEQVSWNDANKFIQKLNSMTGKQYRLPTEEEWEYACHGGRHNQYCGGDDLDAVGWYEGNSNNQTHPVGKKQENGYGLYDMTGNVWEWMSDCWEGNCERHALRGGSWFNYPPSASAALRFALDTASRDNYFGFRLSRTLP